MAISISSDIPNPDNPGGTGDQTAGPVVVARADAEPLAGLMDAVNGIVESRPRGLGGDVAAVMVQGMLASYQTELKSARINANRLQDANDQLAKELASTKETIATLTSELGAMRKQRAFSSLGLTLATVLAGLAVDAYKSGADRFAIGGGIIALALIVGCWAIPVFNWKSK